jgi:hypothetical protein
MLRRPANNPSDMDSFWSGLRLRLPEPFGSVGRTWLLRRIGVSHLAEVGFGCWMAVCHVVYRSAFRRICCTGAAGQPRGQGLSPAMRPPSRRLWPARLAARDNGMTAFWRMFARVIAGRLFSRERHHPNADAGTNRRLHFPQSDDTVSRN